MVPSAAKYGYLRGAEADQLARRAARAPRTVRRRQLNART